jgi:4-hydroxybenzoate polyprenyltransferase
MQATKTKTLAVKILRFTKIEHTAFSLPLIFTGAWMGGGHKFPSFWVLLLIVLAATGARVFGMAFNRIFDRKIDALNPRTAQRELPSGTMAVSTALIIAFAGLALYLLACALLGGWCLKLAVIPLIPLLGYSLLKRITPFCHFGIGLCLALAPLGAFVAAAGHPRFTFTALLFSLFVFGWLSGADIIYALLDIESDRNNGIHSLPAQLGAEKAQMVAAGVHFTALIFLMAVVLALEGGNFAWTGLGITALALIGTQLPFIPAGQRFFPIATIAGIAGAVTPMLA